jgi:hypothetical protein
VSAPLTGLIILAVAQAVLLVFFLKKISRLKQALADEKKRGQIPVLNFAIDIGARTFRIVNEGSCTAKDIVIEDVLITFDYQFKKTVRLAFLPAGTLHPSKSADLDYRIYEGDFDITREVAENFFAQLKTSTFIARLRYKNYENVAFTASVENQQGNCTVLEVRPEEVQA